MNPVLVIWNDAHAGSTTWEFLENLVDDGPYEVKSVGYLLTHKAGGKKNHVSIIQSWTNDGCVDSILHIPAKMVVRVIQLTEETHEHLSKTRTDSTTFPQKSDPPRP